MVQNGSTLEDFQLDRQGPASKRQHELLLMLTVLMFMCVHRYQWLWQHHNQSGG